MERHIKWFDLARFGAALRVVPDSPLRGGAVMCFEVRDRDLFQRMYGWPTDRDVTAEERRALHESFTQTKRDLGFSEHAQPVNIGSFDNNTFQQYLRFFSAKTKFTISELRRICPGLEESDLREMPESDVRIVTDPQSVMDAEWAAFADKVLAPDNKGVWTPVVNPYDKPFAESGAIPDADPGPQRKNFPLLDSNSVTRFYGMADKLDRANYRQNALVPFYADLESAQADGWKRDELQQVDLPYAAPLWVTHAGQIIAVKDVRFAPEIMDIGPEQYYSAGAGLIVSSIREAKAVTPVVAKAVQQWREWGASPEKLEMPDVLWGSITEVVSTLEDFRKRFPRLPADIKHLTDGKDAERGGAVRAKPLTDISEGDVRLLALAVTRYVPMTPAEQVGLAGSLGTALKRGHELMADHAKALAKQKLREVAATVQTDTAAPGESKVKHVDSGEKIGGARKDYARRSMTVDDLDDMNDMERKAYVLKKNVWPSLNYQQMREDGVSPRAAIAIKYLKDAISVAPDYRRDSKGEGQDVEYIKAVAKVRDAMAEVKTLDEFSEACRKLCKEGNAGTNYIYGGSAFQIALGSDACHLLHDSEITYGWGENAKTEACVPDKIKREISKRERRLIGWSDRTATDDQMWSSLVKAKREKSDAEKDAEAEKAEQDRELHRPHLDRVERSGEDWRSGRDIVADDLIAHFGFRAVEFGNWLPQDERQQVLNMAFDSLCDLADALDIPPTGVSFDGELAVAFGSRGRGGKHAALAHFEPSRFVINLTRMKGAGSLAHEWFHGLDFHLGDKTGYASELREGDPRGSVMGALTHAMKNRLGDVDEIHERAVACARSGANNALSWLYLQSDETKKSLKEVMESLYQKAETVFTERAVRFIEASKDRPGFAKTGMAASGAVTRIDDIEDEIFETLRKGCDNKPGFTKHKDKVEGNIAYMVRKLAVACTVEAARSLKVDLPQSFLSGPNGRETGYYGQGQKLDETRSSPYWATTRELFARAGAAYVLDRLDAKGARSDYLVYGADEQRYANHPVGNPNPTGEDRRVLAEHFNSLMTEYRLRCVSRAEADAGMEP